MKQYVAITILTFLSLGQTFPQKLLDYRGTFAFPEGKDSVMTNKEIFTYTPQGWLGSKSVYYYDNQIHQWVGNMYPVEECLICPGKYEYLYNHKGQRIQTTAYSWFGISRGWVRQLENFTEYNDEDLPVYQREGMYDNNTGANTNVMGIEMSYDGSGNMIERIYYRWNTGDLRWDPAGRETWEYQASGLDTVILWAVRNWSTRDNTWTQPGYQKIEKGHDDQGHLTLTTWSVPNGSSWRSIKKEERTYDPQGHLLMTILWSTYGTENNWKEELRTTYTIDNNGRMVYEERKGVMQRTIGLSETLKLGRYFDADGDVWLEIWYYFDRTDRSYKFWYKDYYFYRSNTGTSPIPSTTRISVYPNPTTGQIRITGIESACTVRLFTAHGQLLDIISQVTEWAEFSNLSSGMYLLEVETDKGSKHVTRIVIL
jgi:hypothetical protein